MTEKGMKFDGEKRRYDLVDWTFVQGLADILTLGAVKYRPNNWKYVHDAEERYFAALMRHIIAWREGERIDPESKKHHLYHACCNLMFLVWFDKRKNTTKVA